MMTVKTENKALVNVLSTMKKLQESNKDFRNVTVYEKKEDNLLSFIALDDVNEKTEISRVTFQVLDNVTKRNSTVYIYFRKDSYCFECANTFLTDYKTSDYETTKRFKESRTNLLTNDIEKTFNNLLQHKAIITATKKTATKKAETTKKATTKKKAETKTTKKVSENKKAK